MNTFSHSKSSRTAFCGGAQHWTLPGQQLMLAWLHTNQVNKPVCGTKFNTARSWSSCFDMLTARVDLGRDCEDALYINIHLNFQSLEVVSRYRDTQLQVTENVCMHIPVITNHFYVTNLFIQWINVEDASKTLGRRCTNVIQMFGVCRVVHKYNQTQTTEPDVRNETR